MYRLLRMINSYTTIEDELKYILNYVRVSGVGIIPDTIPDSLRLRISRRYRKKGKIFWFDSALVKDLEPYRNYVIFLVREVVLNDSELEVPKHIGVLYAEFQKYPERIIRRFPAWQVVKGAIRVGRSKYVLKGVMRVPTYDKYSVLFITHPEDIVREYTKYEPGIGKTLIKEFLLQNIIDKYRYNPARNKIVTTQHLTTPLFTPR